MVIIYIRRYVFKNNAHHMSASQPLTFILASWKSGTFVQAFTCSWLTLAQLARNRQDVLSICSLPSKIYRNTSILGRKIHFFKLSLQKSAYLDKQFCFCFPQPRYNPFAPGKRQGAFGEYMSLLIMGFFFFTLLP